MKASISPLRATFTSEHPRRVFAVPFKGKHARREGEVAWQIFKGQISREITPVVTARNRNLGNGHSRQRRDAVLHLYRPTPHCIALLLRLVLCTTLGPLRQRFRKPAVD